jgi:hypothetical protein
MTKTATKPTAIEPAANPFATMVPPTNIDALVAQYVKLRDKIKEADDAHKEKMAPAKGYLETLNGALLAQLQAVGGDSVKTPHGTAYKTTKRSATVADSGEFRAFIIENRQWDIADWRANAPAVEAFLQENQILPPGVNMSSVVVVGVRRA